AVGRANAVPRPAKPARQNVGVLSFQGHELERPVSHLPDARSPVLLTVAAPALPAAARRPHAPTTGFLPSDPPETKSRGDLLVHGCRVDEAGGLEVGEQLFNACERQGGGPGGGPGREGLLP